MPIYELEKSHGMGGESSLYSSEPNFGKEIQIMKRIVTIVLVLFISIVFIAACAESENLIGTWKPQSLLLNGEPVDVPFEPLISMSSTYEFTERGTIRVTTADSWNYTSSEDTIVFTRMGGTDDAVVSYSEHYTFYGDKLVFIKSMVNGISIYMPYIRLSGTSGLVGKWIAVITLSEESFQEYLKDPEVYDSLIKDRSVDPYIQFNEDGSCEQGNAHEMLHYAIKGDQLIWTQMIFGQFENGSWAFDYRYENGNLVLSYNQTLDRNKEDTENKTLSDRVEVFFERIV
jgi:hypothetical protein